MERVVADGKHLRLGPAPYRVKGVTYGHFAPRGDGFLFPETPQVERDLTAISEHGFTVVRTYSVPPPDLLDTARALGLRLLVGLRYDDWRGPGERSPWRLRSLVARMWGRLRGHPLPPRAPADQPWTGRREDWLRALQRELSSRWCAVRAGPPGDTWDLQVGAGPLLRCRLRTAVRWEWDPVVRRSWTISGVGVGVAALAATVILLLVDPGAGASAVGALLVTAAVETAVLLRLTGGALDRTTAELRSRS